MLNKQQVSGRAAYLHCYSEMFYEMNCMYLMIWCLPEILITSETN